jgi:hypothetical protein
MTKLLSILTGLLTLAIAIIGFTLSYNALWQVAIDYGIPVNLAPLWPLLIDATLIVFSIGVLNSVVNNGGTRGGWVLVGVFTLLTLIFNAVHVFTPEYVKPLVKLLVAFVPPVAMFLAFERLMFQVGDNLRVNTDKAVSVTTDKPVIKPVAKQTSEDVKPPVKIAPPVVNADLQPILASVKNGNNSRVAIANHTKISRPTVGKRVNELINKGILHEPVKGQLVLNGNGKQ